MFYKISKIHLNIILLTFLLFKMSAAQILGIKMRCDNKMNQELRRSLIEKEIGAFL